MIHETLRIFKTNKEQLVDIDESSFRAINSCKFAQVMESIGSNSRKNLKTFDSSQFAESLRQNGSLLSHEVPTLNTKKNNSANTKLALGSSRTETGEKCDGMIRKIKNPHDSKSVDQILKYNSKYDNASDSAMSKTKKMFPQNSLEIKKLLNNFYINDSINQKCVGRRRRNSLKCFSYSNPYFTFNSINDNFAFQSKRRLFHKSNLDWNFVPFKSSDMVNGKSTGDITYTSHLNVNLLPLDGFSYLENERKYKILTKSNSKLDPTLVPVSEKQKYNMLVNFKRNSSQLQVASIIPLVEKQDKTKRHYSWSNECQLIPGNCMTIVNPGNFLSKKYFPCKNISKICIAD